MKAQRGQTRAGFKGPFVALSFAPTPPGGASQRMRTAPAEAAGPAALAAEQQQQHRGSGGGARVGLCLLCGLPAAGKSTLGRALSRRLPQRPGWACALLAYDELIPPEAFRTSPSPLVSAAALIGRGGCAAVTSWRATAVARQRDAAGPGAVSPHVGPGAGSAQRRRCGP